jgi:hypothetical protein
MWRRLVFIFALLVSFLVGTSASMLGARRGYGVHHRRLHHRIHHRYYIRHRTKWQHAKIIGGAAKTGASVGGLIGGPPGMAVGAVAGAGAGTAYDLKTRKQKAGHKVRVRA